MKLHSLPTQGKKRRRLGRGISAGQGKTAGRGTKGQKARTGKKLRPGFEGGQTPFFQKIPKLKGFRNPNYVPYQVVNVGQLNELSGAEVTKDHLFSQRLIRKKKHPVKVLGTGEVSRKMIVRVEAASAGAIAKIEKAGGSFESTAPLVSQEPAPNSSR